MLEISNPMYKKPKKQFPNKESNKENGLIFIDRSKGEALPKDFSIFYFEIDRYNFINFK